MKSILKPKNSANSGNNSVTETFAEGRPMIVLPLFGDQYDNAQRLQETGLGVWIDPYTFTESELLDGVEKILRNEALKQKLQAASQRIQSENRHQDLAVKIENLSQN